MPAITSLHAALPAGDGAPEWVQLIPAGTFSGADGRGPYTLDDPDAVIAASGDQPMVLDENHATDVSVTTACPAPARGWIVELQGRGDGEAGGIWGRIDWTSEGRRMVAAREYRGISPVFSHDKASGRVLRVLRAGLTNVPNLGVATLHHQQGTGMTLIEKLRAALGLKADADEDGVVQAATARHAGVAAHAAEIGRIAKAAGAADGADADAVVTALQARGATGLNEVVALQGQVTQLQQDAARVRATAAVDAAMKAGKPIPASRREEVITKHMTDPAGTEAWLEMMHSVNTGGMGGRGAVPPAAGIEGSDQAVIAMMGIDPAAYAKRKAELGEAIGTGASA